jgi:hypothetical protein
MPNRATSNVTVLPAFGRDYKSKKAMLEDFKNNYDFEHRNLDGFLTSGIASKEDFGNDTAWKTLQFRYKNIENIFVLTRAQFDKL